MSIELAIVSPACARHLRDVVAKAAGTDAGRVLLGCTHTHSGPDLEEPSQAYAARAAVPASGSWNLDSPGQRYMADLTAKLGPAAARAAGLLFPVELRTAQAPLGLAYTRRVAGRDRMRLCWNPEEWPQLPPGPSSDPTCTVLAFVQTNGPRRYVVWSAGAHPVVLGKTSRVVSADWPGAACRTIEASQPGVLSGEMKIPAIKFNTKLPIRKEDPMKGKTQFHLLIIVMLASVLSLAGCAEDGTDGINGTNGTNGTPGADGTDGGTTTNGGDFLITSFHGKAYLESSGEFDATAANPKYYATAEITSATAALDGTVTVNFTVDDNAAVPDISITSVSANIAKLMPATATESYNQWVSYIKCACGRGDTREPHQLEPVPHLRAGRALRELNAIRHRDPDILDRLELVNGRRGPNRGLRPCRPKQASDQFFTVADNTVAHDLTPFDALLKLLLSAHAVVIHAVMV